MEMVRWRWTHDGGGDDGDDEWYERGAGVSPLQARVERG